jgi:hypothetical protein
MSQTAATPQITGTMFLFEKPELLNIEQHQGLGLDPAQKPFGFCAKIRAVPLTISEIPEASKHYPVVFHSVEEPLPIAVVGLGSDFNLFVDDEGQWERNTYVPGYLRRYPFALASETGGERMALVFDTAYEGVSTTASRKLFENGQLSDFSKQAMDFTRTYENDRRITEQALKALKKYEIVQPQTAQYTPAGSPDNITFAQYFGIDEKKLQELSDEQFLEIRRSNVLPIIYAQLMSMANWRHLISRRMQRFSMTEAEAITPQRLS